MTRQRGLLTLFPAISRRVPITRLCFVSNACACALYAALPFATMLPSEPLVILTLVLLQALLRCCLGTTFTCTFTLLNNAVTR